jgi:cyclophilin family peptidyl-prolyl cis-trans isomerase
VRAALASGLSTFPAAQVNARLVELTGDHDARVRGPALRALASVGIPDLAERLFQTLEADDLVVRATAAELIGDTRPVGGVEHLAAAYTRGAGDSAYAARAAALGALAKYATEEARAVLRSGLEDKAWPVRLRAAELLRALGDADVEPALPAPLRQPASYFESAEFLHPAYSPHAFIETKKGTIEIELNLVEAPVASQSFIDLARIGFYNGMAIHRVVPNFVVQAGDPRGDGEGGPGFTIMDELSTLPYLRGTVGLALDWRDTGGSQLFITVSPQPHLDARYTVFGRAVNGLDVLDELSQWDVIERVRIWDGVSFE